MGSNYMICIHLLVLVLSKLAHTTLSSTSEIGAVLRTCWRERSNEEEKTEVTIPNIFMSTNQTTAFGVISSELKCQSGIDEIKSSIKYSLVIRPSGYIAILSPNKKGGIFYSTNQYCIHGISENELLIQTCNRICTDAQPCINKCCPPDEIYKVYDENAKCKDAGDLKYTPRIYTSSSEEAKGEVNPWYSWHPAGVWLSNCPIRMYNMYAFGKEVAIALGENSSQRFRIRAGGEKVLWNSYGRYWQWMESSDDYCVDGILSDPDQTFENTEEQTVMKVCAPEYKPIQDLSHYYGILYLSTSWFALITLIVYALLWEKQNIHGWTIMSYCTAVFFWFILAAFAHLTKTDFKQTSFCTFAATMQHFFVIATFSWLALISFDLWNTFASMSILKGKGVKKFIFYSLFGWGIPLILVAFSWSMELLYSDDDESEIIIPRYGVRICYIYALGLYVYLPFGILMLANLLLFSMTTWKLVQIKRSVRFATENLKKDRQSYSLFLKLFFVTGALWIFEIISWLVDKSDVKWYWAVLDSLNGISPFCIFVIFICKRDMIKSLDCKYPFIRCITSPILWVFDRDKTRSSIRVSSGIGATSIAKSRTDSFSPASNIEMQTI